MLMLRCHAFHYYYIRRHIFVIDILIFFVCHFPPYTFDFAIIYALRFTFAFAAFYAFARSARALSLFAADAYCYDSEYGDHLLAAIDVAITLIRRLLLMIASAPLLMLMPMPRLPAITISMLRCAPPSY